MEQKRVLVLGAGLVARPLVRYLLDKGHALTLGNLERAPALALLDGHPAGEAVALDVGDAAALARLVESADLVVSLLPATRHLEVARHCLEQRRHLITASYISPEMRDLDAQARALGLLFLNECGLDPGIDHMSAMQIIHQVRAAGGHIASFVSWCGGLPAPEADTNPWRYKFSWSPRGVLVAAMSHARWLEEGVERRIEAGRLFVNHRPVVVPGAGTFEGYPNRDSTGYISSYGLDKTRTMLRGTLRLSGHCARWNLLVRLGLLAAQPPLELAGRTYAQLLRAELGCEGDLETALAERLGLEPGSEELAALRWLGLFEEQPVPLAEGAWIDVLADAMQRRMKFEPGERDLIVLKHEFVAEYPERNHRERIVSSLVDYGIPGGDSAMARTVSLPAAIAAHRVLTGELTLQGVLRPVMPEIYVPILAELSELGIVVRETSEPLPAA